MTAPTTTILVMLSYYRVKSAWKIIEVDPRGLPADFLSETTFRISKSLIHMSPVDSQHLLVRRRFAELSELLEAIS